MSGPSVPRLKFGGLPHRGWNSPTLGFSNFDVRGADGWALSYRRFSFDCGGGSSLQSVSSGGDHMKPGPWEFESPFFSKHAQVADCIDELKRSGRYRLTIEGAGGGRFDARGKLPLQFAFNAERAFRRSEFRRAATGRCQFMSLPPFPS